MKQPIEFLAITYYSDDDFTSEINEAIKKGFIVVRSGYSQVNDGCHWAHLERYRDDNTISIKINHDSLCAKCKSLTPDHCRGTRINCDCKCGILRIING